MLIPNKNNLCSREAEKMLSIKIDNICNMNCSFCVDRDGYNPPIIDIDLIAEKAISFSQYKTVIITGGEPFLVFDKVIKLLTKIRPYKDRIVLNTNGSLLTAKKVDRLNGLIDELQVSVHNPNIMKNAKVLGKYISFDNIKESCKGKKFLLSINSTFNNSYAPDEREFAINKMCNLCHYLGAKNLRLTELKKVDDSEFIPASEFISNEISKYDSDDLITKGCTSYIKRFGINVSVKRLCKYAKGKNAQAFSCCFIDLEGQRKIDVDTVDTFKVIYSNGQVTNDWIFNNKNK